MSEMKNVKEEVKMPSGVERAANRPAYVPRADIYESDAALTVLVDLPGVDEAGVDLTLEQGVLTIRGTVRAEPPAGFVRAYAEYEIGDYERAFNLSDEVDRDQIQASIRDGVLKLVLPKRQDEPARKIKVKTV